MDTGTASYVPTAAARPPTLCHSETVLRAYRLLLLTAVVAFDFGLVAPSAEAQVCRRQCRKGETRNVRGCCVPSLRRSRRSATVRIEADVRRATVTIDGIRRRMRLPGTVRVRPGRRTLKIRAGRKLWRGVVNARARATTRVFASVAGREWPQTARQRKRAIQVLRAAAVAKGGVGLRSVRYTGTSAAAASRYPNWSHTLIWDLRQRRRRWTLATKGQRIVRGLTGARAWTAQFKNQRLGKVDTRAALPWELASLWWHPHSILHRGSEPGVRVAWLPPRAQANVIQLARADGSARVRLFIDKRTKLLTRIQPILRDGRFDQPIRLSDYRRVQRVAIAHRWQYQKLDVQWARVRVNVPTADSMFAAPKPPAPAADRVVVTERVAVAGLGGVARVNADAMPDMIALQRVTRIKTKAGRQLSRSQQHEVVAYDGRTLKPLWKRQFKRRPKLTVVRDIVLVAPRLKPQVLVVNARNGRTLRTLKRSDRVKALCNNPRNGDQVYIHGVDRRDIMFHAKGRKVSIPPLRPFWCGGRLCTTSGFQPRVGCNRFIAVRNAPYGRRYWMPYRGGKVVIAVRRRGTKLPMAAYYDKSRNEVWRTFIGKDPETGRLFDADVGGGRVVYAYKDVDGHFRIGARRLDNGKHAWDVKAGGGAHPLVTNTRVYAATTGGTLDILDTKTGRRLGKIGQRRPVEVPTGAP